MENSNALAIIEKARTDGALVFVNPENFNSGVELYKTEATVIKAAQDEFHNLSGKYMPNRSVTDRIGEASGVQFITGAVRAENRDDAIAGKRTVFVATAQGKVRMPDGSWRTSSVQEYEFDPTLRSMLDKNVIELNESTRKAIARQTLEYTKNGRQRAATGARLRVIRELTGMPVSFTAEDIKKPMVFSRIVQNTAHILDTKEGRLMATAQALGTDVSAILFGNKANQSLESSPASSSSEIPEGELKPADTSGFDDSTASETDVATLANGALNRGEEPAEGKADTKEFQELTVQLEELLNSYKDTLDRDLKSGQNPYKSAKAELDDFSATVDSRKSMIKRTTDFLRACKVAI